MPSRKILIDVTRLLIRLMGGRQPTGVDRVGLAYIEHYADQARAALIQGQYSAVLSRKDSIRLFDTLVSPGPDALSVVRRIIFKAFVSGWRARNPGHCFLLNTGHRGPEHHDYAASLRRQGARLIYMVHDLIPVTHAEFCRPGVRDRHLLRMRHAAALSHGMIANSQDTLEALRSVAHTSGWRLPPAVVAPLAPGHRQVIPGQRPMDSPYFVMVGTIEARKNHWLILQLWRRLVEQLGAKAPRLVLIGQRGWEIENVLDLLERCDALRGFVFEYNHCTDAQLITYLHHAQALLFPSFVEGYGMPLVEAFAMGVPVIASNQPVFREIAADIPEYVDPLDGLRWQQMIIEYTDASSHRRNAQLARIASFQAPTWDQHLAIIDEFLERLGEQF